MAKSLTSTAETPAVVRRASSAIDAGAGLSNIASGPPPAWERATRAAMTDSAQARGTVDRLMISLRFVSRPPIVRAADSGIQVS